MTLWTRTTSLGEPSGMREVWSYRKSRDTVARDFPMTVTIGKPFDVLRLKGADLEETRAYADDLAKLARRLYGDGNSRRVPKCPACDVDARNAREVMTIFGVGYVQCLSCAHVFVGRQVEPAVFAKVFTETADHSAPYVDREGAERRVVEIVMPKIDWLANVYRDAVGGAIRRCIDVGAGGGISWLQ